MNKNFLYLGLASGALFLFAGDYVSKLSDTTKRLVFISLLAISIFLWSRIK